MDGVKTRKDQKPLRQTTLDEFTGGDLIVGVAESPLTPFFGKRKMLKWNEKTRHMPLHTIR